MPENILIPAFPVGRRFRLWLGGTGASIYGSLDGGVHPTIRSTRRGSQTQTISRSRVNVSIGLFYNSMHSIYTKVLDTLRIAGVTKSDGVVILFSKIMLGNYELAAFNKLASIHGR
ncbi:hypothetical protein PM082_003991 [Marasmius tenuissimus]|nr:hypothetical protein PM082_003991 [Marasmius tenuissimus]